MDRPWRHSLDVHLEAGGDEGGVLLVPAAVEAFGVGVGSTGHHRLSRRSCRQKSTRRTVRARHWFLVPEPTFPTSSWGERGTDLPPL